MRRALAVLAAASAVSAVLVAAPPSAVAANTYLTNPLGFAYVDTDNVNSWYGRPTGMVVAGPCNRNDPEFAAARANGAEVLAYIAAPERPDERRCALSDELYGDPATTPLWPYPTYGQRVNWAGTHLTDMRVGSAWVDHVVDYIEGLMVEDRVDGVFLDVTGARLWSSLAAWDSWPQVEKDRWTAGHVDFVRRLDERRRAVNPRFIIVNNSIWDGAGSLGRGGEPYVDGICIEKFPHTAPHKIAEAARAYGNLGHRRVLVIANGTADAQGWADVQGVTHVSDQSVYRAVSEPPIGFNRLLDRPKRFGRITVAASASGGMAANQNRGSRFTLTDKATLIRFSAYLDGNGGAAGTQPIRMALYADNNGVPGARLVQTPTVNLSNGFGPAWVNFNTPPTEINPGNYWLTMHTGAEAGVLRNRRDGPANWYAAVDNFADGAANPFPTGWVGNGTLSLYATYTVGHP